MAKAAILVIEDDEDIRELISYNLEREKYSVTAVESGEAAFKKISKEKPDLILLDLMLPEINGFDVCKHLKAESDTKKIPIIMVTAKGEESDIVTGLELGADDYVTKPFKPKELIARIRAVLRRAKESASEKTGETIKIHELEIHPGKREVLLESKPVDLTFTEFQILHILAKRAGWVFTRYQIVDAVKGENYAVTDRAVDVQIVGLRKKLGEAGKYIQTVRGIGYRFME